MALLSPEQQPVIGSVAGNNKVFFSDKAKASFCGFAQIRIGSKVRTADFANISLRGAFYSSNDDYSRTTITNSMLPEGFKAVQYADVVIGKHAIIGSGSVVLPGVTLYTGAAVGALSMVNRDCDTFAIYAGQRARWLKDRSRYLLKLEQQLKQRISQQ